MAPEFTQPYKTSDNDRNIPSVIKHTNKKSFKCKICKTCFTNLKRLQKHYLDHIQGDSFSCRFCQKLFATEELLKRHILQHTGVKCDICKRYFPSSEKLQEHSYIHTEERRRCDICDRTFTLLHHLKRHKKLVHFSSKNCKENNAEKSNAIDEANVSGQERLVDPSREGCDQTTCKTIPKPLSHKHKIKQKQKTKSFPGIFPDKDPKVLYFEYECVFCKKIFTSTNNLREHFKNCVPNKDYSSNKLKNEEGWVCKSNSLDKLLTCNICKNKNFDYKIDYTLHLIKYHGQKALNFGCNVRIERLKIYSAKKLKLLDSANKKTMISRTSNKNVNNKDCTVPEKSSIPEEKSRKSAKKQLSKSLLDRTDKNFDTDGRNSIADCSELSVKDETKTGSTPAKEETKTGSTPVKEETKTGSTPVKEETKTGSTSLKEETKTGSTPVKEETKTGTVKVERRIGSTYKCLFEGCTFTTSINDCDSDSGDLKEHWLSHSGALFQDLNYLDLHTRKVLDLRSLYPYHGECVLCSEICTSNLSVNHLIQQIRLHWKSSHANTSALVSTNLALDSSKMTSPSRDDPIDEKDENYEELCEERASDIHLDQEKYAKLSNPTSQLEEMPNIDMIDENISDDAFSNTNHESSELTFFDVKTSNENVGSNLECFTGDERELNEEIMLDDDIKMEAVSDSEGEEDNTYGEEEDCIDYYVLGQEKDNFVEEGSNII